MPRKIKIVNVGEEQPVEQPVEQPIESYTQEQEQVKEPEPIINEPIASATAETAIETVIDEPVTPPISRPKPPAEPPPEPPSEEANIPAIAAKPKKQPAMGTCTVCNKTMLMKTLKYSHPKLCLTNKPPTTPRVKKTIAKEEPEIQKPVFDGVVRFDNHTSTEIKPIDNYNQHRQARILQKQARVKSLISKAV